MSLLGAGVVAIWNDIEPTRREDFHHWHDCEHIPERLAIPGFLRGRRWMGRDASPEYFTLYEVSGRATLTSPAYLERLNNPTLRTRDVTQQFCNTVRGVGAIEYTSGPGAGGAVLTCRFDPASAAHVELVRGTLVRRTLPALGSAVGTTGAHLCITDPLASGVQTAERRGREVGVPSWIVLIEAIDGDRLAEARSQLTKVLLGFGLDQVQSDTYSLQIACEPLFNDTRSARA